MSDILFRFLNNTSHRSSVAGIQLTSSMPSLWEFCFYGHFLRILRTDHFSLAFNLADSSLCSFFPFLNFRFYFLFLIKNFFPSKFYYIHFCFTIFKPEATELSCERLNCFLDWKTSSTSWFC